MSSEEVEDEDLTQLRQNLMESMRSRGTSERQRPRDNQEVFDTDMDDLVSLRQAALHTIKPSTSSESVMMTDNRSFPFAVKPYLRLSTNPQFPPSRENYRFPMYVAHRNRNQSNLIVLTQPEPTTTASSAQLILPQDRYNNTTKWKEHKTNEKSTNKWDRLEREDSDSTDSSDDERKSSNGNDSDADLLETENAQPTDSPVKEDEKSEESRLTPSQMGVPKEEIVEGKPDMETGTASVGSPELDVRPPSEKSYDDELLYDEDDEIEIFENEPIDFEAMQIAEAEAQAKLEKNGEIVSKEDGQVKKRQSDVKMDQSEKRRQGDVDQSNERRRRDAKIDQSNERKRKNEERRKVDEKRRKNESVEKSGRRAITEHRKAEDRVSRRSRGGGKVTQRHSPIKRRSRSRHRSGSGSSKKEHRSRSYEKRHSSGLHSVRRRSASGSKTHLSSSHRKPAAPSSHSQHKESSPKNRRRSASLTRNEPSSKRRKESPKQHIIHPKVEERKSKEKVVFAEKKDKVPITETQRKSPESKVAAQPKSLLDIEVEPPENLNLASVAAITQSGKVASSGEGACQNELSANGIDLRDKLKIRRFEGAQSLCFKRPEVVMEQKEIVKKKPVALVSPQKPSVINLVKKPLPVVQESKSHERRHSPIRAPEPIAEKIASVPVESKILKRRKVPAKRVSQMKPQTPVLRRRKSSGRGAPNLVINAAPVQQQPRRIIVENEISSDDFEVPTSPKKPKWKQQKQSTMAAGFQRKIVIKKP